MRSAAWVLGYHGCDKTVGEAILRGEQGIRPSSNKFDWLGNGSYFWENSPGRAMHWAKFLMKNPGSSKTKITKPFVIGAIINPGHCLDLVEHESLELLGAAYPPFRAALEKADEALPKNTASHSGDMDLVKRKLDCAVIEFLHRLRKEERKSEFNTVRGPFFEGKALFEGSKIHSFTHLQWCVRTPETHILGYFRPRLLALS